MISLLLPVVFFVVTAPSPCAASLSGDADRSVVAGKAEEIRLGYRMMMAEASDYRVGGQQKKAYKVFRKQLKALLKRDRDAWAADKALAAARPELESVLQALEEQDESITWEATQRLNAVQGKFIAYEEALALKPKAATSEKEAAERAAAVSKRKFHSDWLLAEDESSQEDVLARIRKVRNAARGHASHAGRFALALKRSSEYKKAFKAFRKGLQQIREELPAGWQEDELLKDLHEAMAASIERAENEGEDWKGKCEFLDRHAEIFIEHLSKKAVDPETRAKLYWDEQPAVGDPGVARDFIEKVEALPWPDPRPVPKADYFEKRAIGEGLDMSALEKGLAESQERSQQWYRAQSDALKRRDESALADARLSGASYSSMRALTAQQGRDRREALDRASAASNYLSDAARNYAMTAAAEEHERARKRGDKYRLKLWTANLDYFESILQDAASGRLTGGPLIANVHGANKFAAEGVPKFFEYHPYKEANRLEAIRVKAKNLDFDLTKRGEWIPAPASYRLARSQSWNSFNPKDAEMVRYAKIVHRIMRNDPRAPEVLANSEKGKK